MRPLLSRILGFAASGLTGTLSLAIIDTAPAGAHCGDHAGSCTSTYLVDSWCLDSETMNRVYEVWADECSGTCYSAGTQGCCESPEACLDAPCKPGGCGASCQYLYTYETQSPALNCGPG